MKLQLKYILIILSLLLANTSYAKDSLQEVQHRWAVINYETTGDARISGFEKLVNDIAAYLETSPDDVNFWIWSGITRSTLAGAKGGLGALSIARDAKADLERALSINSKALDGSAYTSLGTLYHKVPGWPIGFGSDETAKEMLLLALSINPRGIDPNYFYGELLYDKGRYTEALKYLNIARDADPRPDRQLADKGRQEEISVLLAKIEQKLKNTKHAFALDRR